MLIDAVMKLTTNDHPDYPFLKAGREEFEKVTHLINEAIRQKECDRRTQALIKEYQEWKVFESCKLTYFGELSLLAYWDIDAAEYKFANATAGKERAGVPTELFVLDRFIACAFLMKGRQQRNFSIPLRLSWMSTSSLKNGVSKKGAHAILPVIEECGDIFEVYGPEQSWIFATDTLGAWIKDLNRYISSAVNSSEVAPRVATKYSYVIGDYEGEWLDGMPHGEG